MDKLEIKKNIDNIVDILPQNIDTKKKSRSRYPRYATLVLIKIIFKLINFLVISSLDIYKINHVNIYVIFFTLYMV